MRRFLSLAFIALIACNSGPAEEPCDALSDPDQDGLDDCMEDELGTDRYAADTDKDGDSDSKELDCLSNPLDVNEACYLCGWDRGDPGTLKSTGSEVGDVIANMKLPDQCGERVAMWDMYGEYHILWHTAAW